MLASHCILAAVICSLVPTRYPGLFSPLSVATQTAVGAIFAIFISIHQNKSFEQSLLRLRAATRGSSSGGTCKPTKCADLPGFCSLEEPGLASKEDTSSGRSSSSDESLVHYSCVDAAFAQCGCSSGSGSCAAVAPDPTPVPAPMPGKLSPSDKTFN